MSGPRRRKFVRPIISPVTWHGGRGRQRSRWAFIGILLEDVEEGPGAQGARGEEAGGVEGRDRRGGVG